MIRVTVQVLDHKGTMLAEGSSCTFGETLHDAMPSLPGAFVAAGFHRDTVDDALLELAEAIRAADKEEEDALEAKDALVRMENPE